MKFGVITTLDCLNSAPQADPRCSDLAFSILNPDICPIQPQLVLKPGLALVCLLGSIQFRAFYVRNGVEQDVTEDTVFTSENLNVAVVGASSGNTTGLSGGTTTITATYQGLTASSEITVFPETDCCDEQQVAMMVLIDTSKSMSLGFNAQYVSRLAYAKAAAERFISEVNEDKDLIGLMSFNDNAQTVLSSPVSNKTAVEAMVTGIIQTQQSTSFHDALAEAIEELNATSADRKVIVLMTDGEDQTDVYDDTNNPIKLLNEFKLQGGVVMVLGVRASGFGYALLNTLATGGFFLNGYNDTADAALDYLSGLKGYICAGNCTPAGDIITPTGQLDYDGFINWDVTDGHVDLIGSGFFDLLPGNGLYVDLAGSTSPFMGTLTSKVAYTIESGKQYRVSLYMAGNQRVDEAPNTVDVRVFSVNGVIETNYLNQTVQIDDFSQDFSPYSFTFTAPADVDVYIEFQQTATPASSDISGLLLDRVKFENVTDVTTILDDDFDDENETYVPPACGVGAVYAFFDGGYGYHSGYECDGEGCLTDPPAAQLQDTDPLSDVEAGFAPPKTYTSTKTACATCSSGLVNFSDSNLIPAMTDNTTPSGTASAESNSDDAWIAFDHDTDIESRWVSTGTLPTWLQYQFDDALVLTAYSITAWKPAPSPKDFEFQGSTNGSTWVTLDSRTGITWFIGETKIFSFTNTTAYAYYRVYITVTGTIDEGENGQAAIVELETFGSAPAQICEDVTSTSEISQQDADTKAYNQALAAAQAELNCVPFYQSTQSYTTACPFGSFGQSITRSASATSFVSQAEADAEALAEAQAAAEAALDCSQSNNDEPITINDRTAGVSAPATPYPSVKHISDMVGLVTKVTVTIRKLSHTSPTDIQIVLRSPSGTLVLLMCNSGGTFNITDLVLIFDDDAASTLPESTLISSGTYQPTQHGGIAPLPSPLPGPPYGTLLSDFVGEDPNGSWALYVGDDALLDDGDIAEGFNISIQTA